MDWKFFKRLSFMESVRSTRIDQLNGRAGLEPEVPDFGFSIS
jgi:hypothetical protein